jgi:hypothetical protein
MDDDMTQPRIVEATRQATPETAGSTPAVSAQLVPQAHGGALRKGNPGNRGRAADAFRLRLQELASNDEVLGYLEECLRGAYGPKIALSAWQVVAAHGYGPPAQRHEVRGAWASIDMTRLSDDQLARLARGEHPLSVLGGDIQHLIAPDSM